MQNELCKRCIVVKGSIDRDIDKVRSKELRLTLDAKS